MSKIRNSANPVSAQRQPQAGGAASIVMHMPAISSQTIAGWSWTPSRRALAPQIQIPTQVVTNAATALTDHACVDQSAATASPTIEPNVPGANGARPAPNPNARQCTG